MSDPAGTEKHPLVKTAWIEVQCFPDNIQATLMRLKIKLHLNDDYTKEIANTLFDREPGNGIICQATQLTWLIHESSLVKELEEKLRIAEQALVFYAEHFKDHKDEPRGQVGAVAREALVKIRGGE